MRLEENELIQFMYREHNSIAGKEGRMTIEQFCEGIREGASNRHRTYGAYVLEYYARPFFERMLKEVS